MARFPDVLAPHNAVGTARPAMDSKKIRQRRMFIPSLRGDDGHVLDRIRVGGYSRSGRVDNQVISGDRENSLIVGIGLRK